MSLSPSAQRAVQWLEQQVTDLAGIRNATPRDPSFKNWRQASLTALQRIWPGDQDRSERFRRIPFSPVDPRADARTVREWYSRGCQEAARVLSGFIEDVRQNGVPEQAIEEVAAVSEVGFEADFPTVDLPAGDLSEFMTEPAASSNTLSEFVDTAPAAANVNAPAPPSLPSTVSTISNTAPEVHASDVRVPRKGMGARLKDLLGFAQLSAKALAGFPRESTPQSSLPSLDARVAPTVPSMDVMPLGGVVENAQGRVPLPSAPANAGASPLDRLKLGPRPGEPVPKAPPTLAVSLPDSANSPAGPSPSGSWPLPNAEDVIAPPIAPLTTPTAPPPAAAMPPQGAAPPPPAAAEPGMSVVMSRPTTLRGAIEKVSIESLLSDQFRAPASPEPGTGALEQMVNEMLTAESAPAAPASPAASTPPAASAPPAAEPPVIPLFQQVQSAPPPRAAVPAPPPAAPADVLPAATAAPVPMDVFEPGIPGIPEPDAIEDEVDDALAEPAAPAPRPSESFMRLPPRQRVSGAEDAASQSDSAVGKVDADAFARATEDFMHSSPVLGATGRKVSRPIEETGFSDPDAIAVASMTQELARLDVPTGRQAEVRARLLDLARRIESGELDWTMLRKAVWFAMEYPEIARRLMPVLLPWIDRAA